YGTCWWLRRGGSMSFFMTMIVVLLKQMGLEQPSRIWRQILMWHVWRFARGMSVALGIRFSTDRTSSRHTITSHVLLCFAEPTTSPPEATSRNFRYMERK